MTWGRTRPEPATGAVPAIAAAQRSAAFRRELRGTVAIVLAIVAVIGVGVVGSLLVGRSTSTIGPGVTVDYGPGWGESRVGPTGLFSHRRPISGAELVINPTFDGQAPDDLLASYRDDVIASEMDGPRFEDARRHDHPAGAAVIQHWTATDPDGDPVVGELVVVVAGATAVIMDGRWVPAEDESVVDEIRRVMASLAIEPLVP